MKGEIEPTCCDNCGAALPAPDAVCPACDHALRRVLAGVVDDGKHRCPRCQARFNKPAWSLVPAKAPWYRFQKQGLQCPGCQVALHDRKLPRLTPLQLLCFWTPLLVSHFVPRTLWQAVLLASSAAMLLWWFGKTSWSVTAEERYAADDPG